MQGKIRSEFFKQCLVAVRIIRNNLLPKKFTMLFKRIYEYRQRFSLCQRRAQKIKWVTGAIIIGVIPNSENNSDLVCLKQLPVCAHENQ